MRLLAILLMTLGSFEANENLLRDIPDDVNLLACAQAENLRIYPVTYSGSSRNLVTLEQAVDDGTVSVEEKGSGEVNSVMVRNRGSEEVFIMAGDIVKGARQDRMVTKDLILPPKSGWIEVSVYCTEHGRWSGSNQFSKADIASSPSLRVGAVQDASQSEIWSGVATAQVSVMARESSTQAFRDIYESASYQDKRDDYWDRLRNLPDRYSSMDGAVVCIGDDIVCVDLFSSHRMLTKMWEKLLDSYIVEAMSGDSDGSVSQSEARSFINDLRRVDVDDMYTPGTGDLYKLDAWESVGEAIIYQGALVHVQLFPD